MAESSFLNSSTGITGGLSPTWKQFCEPLSTGRCLRLSISRGFSSCRRLRRAGGGRAFPRHIGRDTLIDAEFHTLDCFQEKGGCGPYCINEGSRRGESLCAICL